MKTFGFSNLDALDRDARQIGAHSRRGPLFSSTEWYGLVARYGLPSGSHGWLTFDDEMRVGLAWCVLPEDRARVVRSCTNLYSCKFDVLQEESDANAVRGFIEEFARTKSEFDRMHFEGFDPSTANYGAVVSGLQAAGWVVKSHFSWGSWYEGTLNADFEQYLAVRPSTLLNTWRRRLVAANKSYRIEFEFFAGGNDVERNIVAYEDIRAKSWKKPEPYQEFIPELIRLAARSGALRFGILKFGDIPAAAQFWIASEGTATIFKLVHVQEYDKFSPGTLLTMQMMQAVLEIDRPHEVNFGRGDDAYKKLWMSSRREYWGIEAANPRTPRGLVHAARLAIASGRNRLRELLNSDEKNQDQALGSLAGV